MKACKDCKLAKGRGCICNKVEAFFDAARELPKATHQLAEQPLAIIIPFPAHRIVRKVG